MQNVRTIIAIWFALIAVSCPAGVEPVKFGGLTMGTTYHVRIVASTSVDVARLQVEVEALLAEIDRQMSTYRPDSELSRFNKSAAGAWFAVSQATADVVAAARAISEKSGGAL